MDNVKELYNVYEFAKMCGVTSQTVKRWVLNGDITCQSNDGKHMTFNKDDYYNYLWKVALKEVPNSILCLVVCEDEEDTKITESVLDKVIKEQLPNAIEVHNRNDFLESCLNDSVNDEDNFEVGFRKILWHNVVNDFRSMFSTFLGSLYVSSYGVMNHMPNFVLCNMMLNKGKSDEDRKVFEAGLKAWSEVSKNSDVDNQNTRVESDMLPDTDFSKVMYNGRFVDETFKKPNKDFILNVLDYDRVYTEISQTFSVMSKSLLCDKYGLGAILMKGLKIEDILNDDNSDILYDLSVSVNHDLGNNVLSGRIYDDLRKKIITGNTKDRLSKRCVNGFYTKIVSTGKLDNSVVSDCLESIVGGVYRSVIVKGLDKREELVSIKVLLNSMQRSGKINLLDLGKE